jgi:hypothetical protein
MSDHQPLADWLDLVRRRNESIEDTGERCVVEAMSAKRALLDQKTGPPHPHVLKWLDEMSRGRSYDASKARELLDVFASRKEKVDV